MIDLNFDDRLYIIEGMITSVVIEYDSHDHYVYTFYVRQNYSNRETIEVTICSKDTPDFGQGDMVRCLGYKADDVEFIAKSIEEI